MSDRVYCCIRCGPDEERCSQEGRSSELRLRRGVGQAAAHTLNNPQVECTGVLLCVSREKLQLQLNCTGDKSHQRSLRVQL